MVLLPGRSPLGAYYRSPLGVRGRSAEEEISRFVAIGGLSASVNNVMTSSNGEAWAVRTLPSAYDLRGVCWGGGQFVAVGDNCVLTSPNGREWTPRTPSESNLWTDVAWKNGLYAAVSSDGAANSQVMTSPDAISWTTRTSAADIPWSSIAAGPSQFIAVALSGSLGANQMQTSPGGISWSARAFSGFKIWQDINYCGGQYVIVGEGVGQVRYSNDGGVTWPSALVIPGPNTVAWMGVTFGAGLYASVSDDSTYRVMTSPYALTWTARSAPDYNWKDVLFDDVGEIFVAVGTNKIMSSINAIDWTSRTSPANKHWLSLAASA